MKQKQVRRLMKAKKKMQRMASGLLSGEETVNNLEYLLKTYEKCVKPVEKYMEKSVKSDENDQKNV